MTSPLRNDAETIRQLRQEYRRAGLNEADVASDPFAQFGRWFAEAIAGELREPNAMTVATATPEGLPSARIVLLKSWDEQGFVFYTNYESQKGREVAANPVAALVFYWPELERQVRVVGAVERTSVAESRLYFDSRPLGSRLGSTASHQSQVISGRDVLEARVRQLEAAYPAGDPPLPDYWGGYRVTPASFEFWQGRPSRVHDRLRYRRDAGGSWVIARLSP
jgi:pyridoxamine 5'-phosphate oxidase